MPREASRALDASDSHFPSVSAPENAKETIIPPSDASASTQLIAKHEADSEASDSAVSTRSVRRVTDQRPVRLAVLQFTCTK
jgi:hypothetical protein